MDERLRAWAAIRIWYTKMYTCVHFYQRIIWTLLITWVNSSTSFLTLIKSEFIHTPYLIYTDEHPGKLTCFHGYFPIKELISNVTDTFNLQIIHYQT